MSAVIISQHQPEIASLASKLVSDIREKFPQTTVHETVGAVVSPGDDYEKAIQKAVKACELLIVMVGPGWNVNDPDSYDFIAIKTALDNETRIVPIMIDDAALPADLAEGLSGLKRRMGSRVNQAEPDFSALLTPMEQLLETGPPPLVPANKPTSEPTPPPTQQAQPTQQQPPPPPQPQSPWQNPPPPQQQQAPYGQPQQPPPSGPYPPQGAPYPPPGPGYYGQPSGSPMGNMPPQKIVGGAIMLGAVTILIMFVAIPWVSFDADKMHDAGVDFLADSSYAREQGITSSAQRNAFVDEYGTTGGDGCTYTGFQIATQADGSSDCDDDSSDDSDLSDLEPSAMGPLENLVGIVPILALGLGIFGFSLFQDPHFNRGKLRVILILSIMLVIFPVLWRTLYTPVYKEFFENVLLDSAGAESMSDLNSEGRRLFNELIDFYAAQLSTAYQTVQHMVVPLLLLLISISAMVTANRKPQQQPPPQYPGQPMPPYQQQPPPQQY